MNCSYCDNPKVIAKGFCRACYNRLYKTGSLEYKQKGKMPQQCSVGECDRPTVALGYCDKHYRNMRRTGEPVPLFGYGERRNHPLYESWRWQTRCAQGRVSRWDEFWVFVSDVGDKPGESYSLRRYDASKPWSPENTFWQKQVGSTKDAKEYAREWRKRNQLRSKGHSLRKQYGISLDDYAQMYDEQEGCCAICKEAGKAYCDVNGRGDTLAVDHCHETGKIRGLLCATCNKALGGFKDSPEMLQRAIEYLKQHHGS